MDGKRRKEFPLKDVKKDFLKSSKVEDPFKNNFNCTLFHSIESINILQFERLPFP